MALFILLQTTVQLASDVHNLRKLQFCQHSSLYFDTIGPITRQFAKTKDPSELCF